MSQFAAETTAHCSGGIHFYLEEKDWYMYEEFGCFQKIVNYMKHLSHLVHGSVCWSVLTTFVCYLNVYS